MIIAFKYIIVALAIVLTIRETKSEYMDFSNVSDADLSHNCTGRPGVSFYDGCNGCICSKFSSVAPSCTEMACYGWWEEMVKRGFRKD